MIDYREILRLYSLGYSRRRISSMRYTPYRGLAAVSNWIKLKFAAMNLKKLASWKALHPRFSVIFVPDYLKNPVFSS